MHHAPILDELLVVFAVSGAVMFLFQWLKIPALVGLLISGIALGPFGFGLVEDIKTVNILAEIGVVILLFSVGLELPLSRVKGMWRELAWVGAPQTFGTLLLTALIARAFGIPWPSAIFGGMLVSMSSTAVVLKLLSDRGELAAPHGKLSVAVLLLQDLLVTAFMLLIPLLTSAANGSERADGGPGGSLEGAGTALLEMGYGLALVAMVFIGSIYIIPPLVSAIVRTRNRELFIISIVVLVIGTATITGAAGLSLALGAFIAGLALSESEYAHQVFAEVLPFRDTLSSLFFVSVGMLLDLEFALAHPFAILGTVAFVIAVKMLTVLIPVVTLGYPPRIAVLTSLALFQVGEFSFVLAERGSTVGLLSPKAHQLFLATAILTMLLTPAAMAFAPQVASVFSRWRVLKRIAGNAAHRGEEPPPPSELSDHVIIAGFGLCGRHLARVLTTADIAHVVLELNPEEVRRSREEGRPIVYGDCTRESVLLHAGIERARMVAVVISDPAATRRTVVLARRLNPGIRIVVRTRFTTEIEQLRTLGADEVIPEDFVTSVELFARVLKTYSVPRSTIVELIEVIRSDNFEAMRGLRPAKLNLLQEDLMRTAEIDSCKIGDPNVGRSIEEIALRERTGALVVALRRNGELLVSPEPTTKLDTGDIALVFGTRPQVSDALAVLSGTAG